MCIRDRVDVIGVVKGIEHFEDRCQRHTFAEPEWTLDTPVKREVVIVLAQRVTICRSPASRRCNGLRRTTLDTESALNSPTKFDKRKEVELVSDVAVRNRVVESEIERIEGTISERVAFV